MELDLITDLDVSPLNGAELYSGITKTIVESEQGQSYPPTKPTGGSSLSAVLTSDSGSTSIDEPIGMSTPKSTDGSVTTTEETSTTEEIIESAEVSEDKFDDGGMMGGGGGGMSPVEEEMIIAEGDARMDEKCKVLGIDCMLFYGGLLVASAAAFYYYKTKIATK